MLKHTFCHVPGIGIHTEEELWASGLKEWEDVLSHTDGRLPIGKGKMKTLKYNIERSMKELEEGDPAWFAEGLPSHEHWRLFSSFRNSVAYVDIETTGMGNPGDYITAVSLYDGGSIKSYVHGDNLADFGKDIQNYDLVVTYNGKCFDIPFIRSHMGIAMDQVHIDLRYVLKNLGYRGGLKGCEKQMGIDRGELDGVDGFFAVLLWQDYKVNKNPRALETLLAYNIEDVVNLEILMVKAYNLKLKATPFGRELALPLPCQPKIAYKADPGTIDKMRQKLQLMDLGQTRQWG